MDITSTNHERAVVVAVAGRMDAVSAPQFEKTCDPFITAGTRNIVADIAGLTYISSMGLGCLLSVAKKLQPKGGKLYVSGAAGMVKEVFRMAGFESIFPMLDNTDVALETVARENQ
jgi:anti-sigma B factor antagonist